MTKLETLLARIRELLQSSIGKPNESAATDSTSSWSVISLLKGLLSTFTSVVSGTTSLSVKGSVVTTKATFTRPSNTTAYTAGDVMSNSTSAPTVLSFTVPEDIEGYITFAKIETNDKAITPRLRLRLYTSAPTAINDNDGFISLYANADSRIGNIDFPALSTGSDTSNSTGTVTITDSARLTFKASGTTIYGIVTTLDNYTPASGTQHDIQLRIAIA